MIFENNKNNIETFIKLIKDDKVVIFPTDSVFGIGCNSYNTKSIEEIYNIKNRNKNKTLLLNLPNITRIKKIAHVNKIEEFLIKTFMPGPLTIILKVKRPTKLSPYTIKNNEIGVRIPNLKTLQTILKKLPYPLISTSCNKSNEPSIKSAKMANKIFPQIPILNTNEKLSGIPSTIIKVENKNIIILRKGSINKNDIKKALKESPYKNFTITYPQ